MFGLRSSAKRFTLLLLEEEEEYVADFVASCTWPTAVQGNVQQVKCMPGSLRLCSKSVFFEPDDVRVPIIRCAFFTVIPCVLETFVQSNLRSISCRSRRS